MGKLSEFSVSIDNARQVYYPGEIISGSLTTIFSSEMKMRSMSVALHGKAFCHWTETSGTGNDQRTDSYSGSEVLIEEVVVLYGNTKDTTHHPVGKFVHRFSFTLPPVLPSSFEGSSGYIRYFLKAKIDKPWKFDHITKIPLVINEVVDTNNPVYLQQPGGEKSKEVGCCCCPSGTLSIRGNVDRQAYCPGETVLITAEGNNATRRDMRSMKAKLVKVIEYHAVTKTKCDREMITKIEGPGIPRGEFANWQNQPLLIPPTVPSIITAHVVQVHYFIMLEIAIPMGFDLSLSIPVILGTVPFRATYGIANAAAPQSTRYEMALGPPPPMGLLGYPEMPPPSYAAAVGQQASNIHDEHDNKNTRGTLSYTPIYTYAQPHQENIS